MIGKGYSTDLTTTETPISEGGKWVNVGLDWTSVAVSGGIAIGTQTGSGGFDDSYAHQTGFGPDQEVSIVVFKASPSGIQEVEILLRATDSAHNMVTYEVNFAHDGQYVDFVRWPGPKGTVGTDFTFLVPSLTYGVAGGIHDGDLLTARIVGNTINAYRNGVIINTAPVVDTAASDGGAVLKAGNPGMGFYRESGSGAANQYGIRRWCAKTLMPNLPPLGQGSDYGYR